MNLSPSDWAFVEERARSFVGREWVFARIRSFLSGPPGIFLLRGNAGAGKTAIAARLAQASSGHPAMNSFPAPSPVAEGMISAAVFCRAGRVTVPELIQRLSEQLAESVEGFAGELQSALAHEVTIKDVRVETGDVSAGAQVAAVRIILSQRDDEWSFDFGVAMPLRNLRERGTAQPIVLLVDAADEAAAGSGINVFSRLLARLDGIHLIVTCRPDARVLADFRAARYYVDLVTDAPPGDQDVRVYIRSRLHGRGPEVTVGVLGDRIANEAAGNFLYAFYVTGALARSGSLADMDEQAARRLPLPVGGLAGVYEEFLYRQIGGDETRWAGALRPVLAPLCVALGDGFTTAQIAAVASRLARRAFPLPEVRDVTRAAGQFLEGPRPDGPFRVYHSSFERFLTDPKQNPNWPIDRADTHTAVLQALRAEGGDRGWLASSPYARRHAHDHAAAAGLLDDLLEDPPYLTAAEPDRLLRVLPEATISRARAREAEVLLYRVGSRMRGRPDGERAAVLELGARQLGAIWIADQLAKLPLVRPWSVRWTHKQPVGHDRILGWHDGSVWAVMVGERNGRAVVVSGGSDGMVRVWDLRAGGLEAEWRHGKGRVKTVTIGQLADGPVVVSGGEDGQLRRWHLADGSPHGEPLDLGKGKVTSAAIGDRDGQPFIVAGYEHLCTVGLWDLDTGQPMGELDWGSDFPLSERLYADVRAVAAGTCNGKPVIVAGHTDGAHRWGWTGSEWAAKPLISKENIWAVALGMLAGRPVAVLGGDSLLTTLDLESGELAAPSYESPDYYVIGVAVGEVDGRAVAVSGNFFGLDRGILRVWDLAVQKAPLKGSLVGHYGGVQALAITRLDDRPVLVSGGFDRAIAVWDLKDSLDQTPDRIEYHHFEWLEACEIDDRPAFISKNSATVSFSKSWVWRKKVNEYHRPTDGPFLISSSSTFEREGTDTPAKPVIRVWDQADGTQSDAHSLDLDRLGDVRAVGRVGDAVLGVSIDDINDLARPERLGAPKKTHLKVRDLRSGASVGHPILVTSDARTLAVGGLGDRPVLAFCDALPGDESQWRKRWLQVWDIRAGRLVWQPLPAYQDRGGPVVRAVGTLDGQPIAVVTALTRFGIWDLQRGELIAEPPSMQGEYDLMFAPAAIGELAGRPVVVYSGYARPIRVWDMRADRECERAIEVDTEIQTLTIAPDSTIIAAGPGGALALRVEDTFFEPTPARREWRTKAVDAEIREFSVAGPADGAYLASVSSGEPLERDREQYAELRRRLSPVIKEDELQSGYDHFGRLVLSGTTARYSGTTETRFAVGWPFLRMEYRPLWSGRDEDLDDAAVIRGEASSSRGRRAVYIFLPDGRIDLLPADEPLWNFGWGYEGTEPWHLKVSICRAAGLLRGRDRSTYPAFERWLDWLVRGRHSDKPLEIPVGLVRAKFQQLKESSDK